MRASEFRRSLLWALLIGTLVMGFGLLFARAAAEDPNGALGVIWRVLLTPAMSVGLAEMRLLGRESPSALAVPGGVAVHYLVWFLIVRLGRAGYRRWRGLSDDNR